MTITKIDVYSTKNTRTQSLKLDAFRVKNNQRQNRISTTLNLPDMDTPEKVVDWLLQQSPPQTEPNKNINKRFIINFHIEQVEDEDGEPVNIKVLDSYEVESLPEDNAKNNFKQLPVFKNGLLGIDDWVNETIIDLPTAKQAIADVAKACFFLQVQLNSGGD